MTFKAKALSLVRRGKREVILTAIGFNGGNNLFKWQLAYSRTLDKGLISKVLYFPNQDAWLEMFPELRKLSITSDQIRFTDRRATYMGAAQGVDYTPQERARFIKDVLLTSDGFKQSLERAQAFVRADDLVINVRRGDYYNSRFEPEFGINIVEYVRQALAKQLALGPVGRVVLVSDNVPWCVDNLTHLAPQLEFVVNENRRDMFDDLAVLACAKRLILANSTFSYWGAFIAQVLGTQLENIVAPAFHQGDVPTASELWRDPRWNFIHEIDGGWQNYPGRLES